MNDVIKKIVSGDEIDKVISYVMHRLYTLGPTSISDLEILSYLALYRYEDFARHQDAVLNYMAVFYKPTSYKTLKDVIFSQYQSYIQDKYQKSYTPVQASIMKGIAQNNCFSFSAPTSTGKSYVFLDKILDCQNDVVVVVPSRALINEYYLRLCELIDDKSVNILTFVDKINTKWSRKSVFVVTPERCRELFRQKHLFQIDLFLFDEAQLSNEDSKRGIYFDSIVRRCQKSFPAAKFVFAHPFVKNPESQIEKNHFDKKTSLALQYQQRNVGQMFLCKDENWNFFHFGIDTSIMGRYKHPAKFDPIEQSILAGGSVLFYVSKAKIYSQEILLRFGKYINLCTEIDDQNVQKYIEQLKEYTGGETATTDNHYSLMLDLLRRGIVIHHGSLPLQTRVVIEQFTRDGYCRICFATSTLEQGINMPFEVVF